LPFPISGRSIASCGARAVTLQLLWEEYRAQAQGVPYSRSRFCERYIEFRQLLRRSMRKIHVAGDKLFVDYAGPTVPLIDPGSVGESRAKVPASP